MTPKDAIKVLNMVEAHGSLTIDAKETAIKALQLMDKFLELPMGLPKTGHWIYTGDYITEGMLKCSSCGYKHDVADRFLYCPNCGAKMAESEG